MHAKRIIFSRDALLLIGPLITKAFYGFAWVPKWLGGLGDLTGASGGRGMPRIGSFGAIWGTRVAGLPQCAPWEPEVRETRLSVVTNAFYGFDGVPTWLRGLGGRHRSFGGGRGVPDWCLTVIFCPTRGRNGCKHGHLRLHADRALCVHPGYSRVMGYIHWSYK